MLGGRKLDEKDPDSKKQSRIRVDRTKIPPMSSSSQDENKNSSNTKEVNDNEVNDGNKPGLSPSTSTSSTNEVNDFDKSSALTSNDGLVTKVKTNANKAPDSQLTTNKKDLK